MMTLPKGKRLHLHSFIHAFIFIVIHSELIRKREIYELLFGLVISAIAQFKSGRTKWAQANVLYLELKMRHTLCIKESIVRIKNHTYDH